MRSLSRTSCKVTILDRTATALNSCTAIDAGSTVSASTINGGSASPGTKVRHGTSKSSQCNEHQACRVRCGTGWRDQWSKACASDFADTAASVPTRYEPQSASLQILIAYFRIAVCRRCCCEAGFRTSRRRLHRRKRRRPRCAPAQASATEKAKIVRRAGWGCRPVAKACEKSPQLGPLVFSMVKPWALALRRLFTKRSQFQLTRSH